MTWSQEWKLNLNAEKSEVCPFSTWSNDSTWNPTIFIGNQKVRVNTTPHLLGVILDRSLTFNAHLKKLTASFTSTIHIIRATALRLEALRLDANVQSYPTCSKSLILKAKEKALRSTDDHPKHIALDVNIPQCLQKRSSFCRKTEELSTLLPPDLQRRQNIIHFPSPPWQQSPSHERWIATSVPWITGRADDNSLKRQCSPSTIASSQADYVIYTDGSASRGTRNGGAAAVVTNGSPPQPDVVTTIKTKGQAFTSSYEEEAAVMESALSWTLTNANHPSITILFSRGSKSLCEALISFHPWTFSNHNSINSISSLFNGSLAILPLQVMISQTKQPKKPPSLPQTQLFLFLYLVLFKSLTRRFVTLHQYTNGLLLYTNIQGFLEMQIRSTTEKMTSSLLVFDPAITVLSRNTSTNLILQKIPSVQIAAKKNKISFTGSVNVRLWLPEDNKCLGTINDF